MIDSFRFTVDAWLLQWQTKRHRVSIGEDLRNYGFQRRVTSRKIFMQWSKTTKATLFNQTRNYSLGSPNRLEIFIETEERSHMLQLAQTSGNLHKGVILGVVLITVQEVVEMFNFA